MRNKSMLERYLEAMQNTGDIMLRWQYQKDMMKQSILDRQERERLIEDVADRVLARISITVDAEDVINAIEDIQSRLDRLGK